MTILNMVFVLDLLSRVLIYMDYQITPTHMNTFPRFISFKLSIICLLLLMYLASCGLQMAYCNNDDVTQLVRRAAVLPVCACVRVCLCACVRVCVRACVRACDDTIYCRSTVHRPTNSTVFLSLRAPKILSREYFLKMT